MAASRLVGHLYGDSPGEGVDKANIITTANEEDGCFGAVVCSDDRAVGRLGAEYLLEKGYRNFAFAGKDEIRAFHLRREGFERSIRKAGRPVETAFQNVFSVPLILHWEEVKQGLEACLRATPKPVAIMACNDQRAMAILQVAVDMGLAVPEEVALLGVDDEELTLDLLPVPLSSIRLNGEAIGYEAVRRLHGSKGRKRFRRREVPPLQVVERKSTAYARLGDPVVEGALKQIEERFAEFLTVENLFADSGLSRAAFDRRFSAFMGFGPYHCLLRRRFREAERLLTQTRLSVTEVANRSGFGSIHEFSRRFKQHCGTSPVAYRQSQNPT